MAAKLFFLKFSQLWRIIAAQELSLRKKGGAQRDLPAF